MFSKCIITESHARTLALYASNFWLIMVTALYSIVKVDKASIVFLLSMPVTMNSPPEVRFFTVVP